MNIQDQIGTHIEQHGTFVVVDSEGPAEGAHAVVFGNKQGAEMYALNKSQHFGRYFYLARLSAPEVYIPQRSVVRAVTNTVA